MVSRNRKLDTSHLCASTVGNNQVWMTPRSQLPLVLLLLLNCLVERIPSVELNLWHQFAGLAGAFLGRLQLRLSHLRIQSTILPLP